LTDSRALSYENRLLLLLFFTFGFVFFDRLAITFLFPSISAELGLTNRHLGILSSVLALTWAVFGFAIPAACDVRGKRKSVLVAMVLAFSVLSALSGWISGFVSLLAVRALMGIAEGPVLPLSQALMASASGSSRRGLNMGLLQGSAAGLFGSVLAPPIVVSITEAWGWRIAFYVSCIPGLLLAALIARYVRENTASTTKTDDAAAHSRFAWSEVWAGVAQVLKYRNIVICLGIGCVYIAWFIVIVSFAPTFLVTERHFSNTTMSWVMAALGAAHVFWGFTVPWISDRLGRKPTMIVFSAISVLAPLFMIYIESPVTLSVLLLLSYTGLGCFTIFMSTIPAETVPARNMATAIGLIMGVGEIAGGFLAPTVAGYAADLYGLQMPFWISAAGGALACLLSLFLTETAPRRVGAPNTSSAQ
jgi:MFS family permease